MSRVTVESLYRDFTVTRTEAREYGAHYEKYAKLAEIEVVPRKMVEMIIKRCDILINVEDVQQYAESLLDMFEEDKE